MKLQDIILDAGVGFTVGFVTGLKGFPESYEERLEIIEAIPVEVRKDMGSKDLDLNKSKTKFKQLKIAFPFLLGGTYSLLTSILSRNVDPVYFGERAMVAVPAAFVGRETGKLVRKLRHPEIRDTVKRMKKVAKDPENPHKHLLSEGQRTRLEKAFSEIEEIGLAENPEKFMENFSKGPVRKIYDIITENPKPYTNLLLVWSTTVQERLFKRLFLQRTVTEFYEAPYEEKLGPADIVDIVSITEIDKPRAKVFTKEQNDFYVQTYEWPNLKILRDDKDKSANIMGKMPDVEVSEREVWTSDYKALTESIMKVREDYPVLLMKAPLEIDRTLRERCVTGVFMEKFLEYTKEKG